jgi:hypothetical protein
VNTIARRFAATGTAARRGIFLPYLALAVVAAGLAFVVPPPADAAELPSPRPFAESLPAHAGQCLLVDDMKLRLGEVIGEEGGIGLMLNAGVQQRFADAWRRAVELKPVTISVILVWLREAAIVAEFDDEGCLMTMTRMSLDEFVRLVHAGAGETAEPKRAPSLRPDSAAVDLTA